MFLEIGHGADVISVDRVGECGTEASRPGDCAVQCSVATSLGVIPQSAGIVFAPATRSRARPAGCRGPPVPSRGRPAGGVAVPSRRAVGRAR